MATVSSALKAVGIRQSPPPMIIGERVNAQGSRKAKEMVLAGDYDGLVDLARSQAEDGAHCLDVCVATTERADEKEFMINLVKRLSLEVDAPLVVDSTDPEVVEAAIRQIPGRPVINSINLEGDGSRFAGMAPVMKRYGIPAIAMCIGPDGMAKTAGQKLRTAELLVERGRQYGLEEWQYIFDVLTFTLATGQEEFLDSGVQTIEGIRLVKERFPEAHTVLGLSNVSFGLDPHPRRIINSVFFYHAVRAGLDCVIVNPRDILPYDEIPRGQRDAAEDLVFNRRPDALAGLLALFDGDGRDGGKRASREPPVNPRWPAGKRANHRIINRIRDGIERDVVLAIADNMEDPVISGDGASIAMDPAETHDAAIRTLNESLLPAMKTVGDRFGAGELILPFVLKSAECMKAAVAELEKYLVKKEGASKGKLVLGTVYGDVHDIGKNLVKTIFQNNGYTVYDLGKQVPMQRFIEKIDEVGADAVGLSALLVNTSREMKHFVDYARKNNMEIPVLCGGAAINSRFINRIATDGGIYGPGAFYCNTMFDGLKTMDRLVSDREGLLEEWRRTLQGRKDDKPAPVQRNIPRSDTKPVSPPVPPAVNEVVILGEEINHDEVWGMIDKKSLFKLSWGLRGRAGRDLEAEHERLYEQWKETILQKGLFEPRVIYGYFRCAARGTGLVVRHPSGDATFDFPRSSRSKHLCLADYFREDEDVVAFQAVTAGGAAERTISGWNEDGRITDAYYLHGLAVEFAEGLAEWTNRRIRSELGLGRGCLRYSWGYPSCPDITQHRLVWRLMEPQRAGMTLTEAGQIIPEQSTAAIIVHHPDAEYFVL